MVIFGIDPGLSATGYGIIEAGGSGLALITAGDIRPPRARPTGERLEHLHRALSLLISRYRPDSVVLEKLFIHYQHVTTAALMAHARGVACLVTQEHGLPLAEYPPTQVKKALTGVGSASKEQVARMVGQWLHRSDPAWSLDATDALALAITYAHLERARQRVPVGNPS